MELAGVSQEQLLSNQSAGKTGRNGAFVRVCVSCVAVLRCGLGKVVCRAGAKGWVSWRGMWLQLGLVWC